MTSETHHTCIVCGASIETFKGLRHFSCPDCGVKIGMSTPPYMATQADHTCPSCDDTGVIDVYEIYNDNPYIMTYACSCHKGQNTAYIISHDREGNIIMEDGKPKMIKGLLFYRDHFGTTPLTAQEQRKRNEDMRYKYHKRSKTA